MNEFKIEEEVFKMNYKKEKWQVREIGNTIVSLKSALNGPEFLGFEYFVSPITIHYKSKSWKLTRSWMKNTTIKSTNRTVVWLFLYHLYESDVNNLLP
jgi:hypothetical protein